VGQLVMPLPDRLEGWMGELRLIREHLAEHPDMNASLRSDFKRDSKNVERLIRYYGARVARDEAARARRP
jgi:hypothetical protein